MLSTETGELSQLTSPSAPHFDRLAAMAPSGDAIAFKRSAAPTDFGSLMLLSLPRSPQPARALEAIGIDKRWSVTTFAWSADGREIIYSAGSGVSFLWRRAVSGDSQPERLSFAGEGARDPATARSGSRLVFSRSLAETNIWSLELDDAGRAKGQAVPAFVSSKMERCPAFSPDGSRVAFESNRSGSTQVWVCSSNGSACSQVTQFAGPHAGSPAWSPDGQWIAFDGVEDEGFSIYKVRPDGGQLQRLARGAVPRWSRDGRWIYYTSTGLLAPVPRFHYRRRSAGNQRDRGRSSS